MNHRPHKTKTPVPRDDVLDDELPPLEEDEDAGDLDMPLDSFLEEQRDDGMSWLDDRIGIDDYDDDEVADEIGALEGADEPTWLDDSEADDTLEGTDADLDDDAEYGWTEDNEVIGADGDWDGEMDFGLEEAPSILDDTGEEGFDEEHLEIDMERWVTLEGEVEGEGIEDDELPELEGALSFEQEARLGGDFLPPRVDDSELRVAWLGPSSAQVSTVAFRGATFVAAGAGLFTPEGNDLRPTAASAIVEEAMATSLEVDPADGRTLWIGTETRGLLVSRDGGATVEAVNGWAGVVRGHGTAEAPRAPVRVAVSPPPPGSPDGPAVLWVMTGQGHLARSTDGGETWTRDLETAEVRAIAADPDRDRLAALIRDDEGLAVAIGESDGRYERRPLPDEAAVAWTSLEPALAFGCDTLLLGDEEQGEGVLCSTPEEPEWKVFEACPRATAAAIARSGGETVLWVALFFAGKDLGTLLRREAGGEWQRVCDVGRLVTLLSVDQIGIDEVTTRVYEVVVNPTDPRQVAFATGRGVFVVQTKDRSRDDGRPL